MQRILIAIFLLVGFNSIGQEKSGADDLLGIWLTGSKNGKVEIYKNGNSYQGKIVWLQEPIDPATGKPKTDVKHPDKSLHQRPVMGLVNLWGFKHKGEQSWENGHIYDPKNGKEYKCIITMKDKNTLDVRGYVGITLIGRTDVWTRTKL
ncbi:MAG: DUF2147 domain-containing protein [Chitinophagia bacterium]|jgi:uncharacterized protein (DUF2147 family)